LHCLVNAKEYIAPGGLPPVPWARGQAAFATSSLNVSGGVISRALARTFVEFGGDGRRLARITNTPADVRLLQMIRRNLGLTRRANTVPMLPPGGDAAAAA
jgi:hypothetical protein